MGPEQELLQIVRGFYRWWSWAKSARSKVPSRRSDLSEDRDIRLYPPLVHQPAQHLGRTIGAISG